MRELKIEERKRLKMTNFSEHFAPQTNNYISLGTKAINNPYDGGKFITSINNDKNDAFNYLMALAGYRITQHGISAGFFVEPRLGVVFGAGGYTGLLLPHSPVMLTVILISQSLLTWDLDGKTVPY